MDRNRGAFIIPETDIFCHTERIRYVKFKEKKKGYFKDLAQQREREKRLFQSE